MSANATVVVQRRTSLDLFVKGDIKDAAQVSRDWAHEVWKQLWKQLSPKREVALTRNKPISILYAKRSSGVAPSAGLWAQVTFIEAIILVATCMLL